MVWSIFPLTSQDNFETGLGQGLDRDGTGMGQKVNSDIRNKDRALTKDEKSDSLIVMGYKAL
jgi:hypothetical protein